MKKITLLLCLFFVVTVVMANSHNTVWQPVNVTHSKNTKIMENYKKQLRHAALQQRQLTRQLTQLASKNQELLIEENKLQDANQALEDKNAQLTQANAQLQGQSAELQQSVVQLQGELHQVMQRQSSIVSAYPPLDQFMQQLDLPFALLCAFAVILMLLLWQLLQGLRRRSKVVLAAHKARPMVKTPEPRKNINYKSLSGEDEVKTKLNLAHAYCGMEDYVGAKEVLAGIVNEGTEQQREEARKLLIKIAKKNKR